MPAFLDSAKNIQPPFDLFVVASGKNGEAVCKLLMTVQADIVEATCVSESDIAAQVCRVSGEIVHWGVLEAKARRAWQLAELNYRMWREALTVTMFTPPSDPAAAKAWKKPTGAEIEATYRSHPEYREHQEAIQAMEEGTNGAHAVLEAFKAKKEMLRTAVRRANDDSNATLSI